MVVSFYFIFLIAPPYGHREKKLSENSCHAVPNMILTVPENGQDREDRRILFPVCTSCMEKIYGVLLTQVALFGWTRTVCV
jgi:hypothetical protein